MLGTTIGLISLGATSVSSIALNIVQGIQNNKLRQQIEMLVKIIKKQQRDIEELKKELESLKIWAFKQRRECSKKITYLENDMEKNLFTLHNLTRI